MFVSINNISLKSVLITLGNTNVIRTLDMRKEEKVYQKLREMSNNVSIITLSVTKLRYPLNLAIK